MYLYWITQYDGSEKTASAFVTTAACFAFFPLSLSPSKFLAGKPAPLPLRKALEMQIEKASKKPLGEEWAAGTGHTHSWARTAGHVTANPEVIERKGVYRSCFFSFRASVEFPSQQEWVSCWKEITRKDLSHCC